MNEEYHRLALWICSVLKLNADLAAILRAGAIQKYRRLVLLDCSVSRLNRMDRLNALARVYQKANIQLVSTSRERDMVIEKPSSEEPDQSAVLPHL